MSDIQPNLAPSSLAKVPVTIVTGFLGAGKTTLISHLIRNAGGRRLAVVVNEFGTLGIDGDILKGCAIPDCPAENVSSWPMAVSAAPLPMISFRLSRRCSRSTRGPTIS